MKKYENGIYYVVRESKIEKGYYKYVGFASLHGYTENGLDLPDPYWFEFGNDVDTILEKLKSQSRGEK